MSRWAENRVRMTAYAVIWRETGFKTMSLSYLYGQSRVSMRGWGQGHSENFLHYW